MRSRAARPMMRIGEVRSCVRSASLFTLRETKERANRSSDPRCSNRQIPRVGSGLTRCKQWVTARPNRQIAARVGSQSRVRPHYSRRRICSRLASGLPKTGVNPCQVFFAVTHSKQRIGLRKGCQFFAIVRMLYFRISTRQYCRIESPVTHTKQTLGTPATRQFFEGVFA